MDKIIAPIMAMYSSKEAIEASAIKDIQQFHTFHGGRYKLGEVLEGQTQVPNLIGADPFDSDVTVCLDEISEDHDIFVISAKQEVNREQLTNATFEYMTKLANAMGVVPPKREDLKELKQETTTLSKIHGTGWVVYSLQTTNVTSADITRIEERTIEIK